MDYGKKCVEKLGMKDESRYQVPLGGGFKESGETAVKKLEGGSAHPKGNYKQ